MNHDDRLNEIFRQARQAPLPEPGDFGFETRLLAGIRAERRPPMLGFFAWRLAPVFAAIALMAGVWDYNTPSPDQLADLGIDDSVLVDYLTSDS